MKRFFARYFLPIFPLLWSLVLLFAGFYNFFVNEFSRDIFLCFMGMGGAMLIASLLSFAAQAKDHKGIGAIAIVFSVVHFLPLFADVMGLRLFRGFVYLFSEIPCLLSILSLAIIVASNILVFCRNNIVPASPAIPDALAQQIQGLRADMGNVINKLRQIDDLKAALSTLETKYQTLEARLAEQPAAADAPAAAPAVSLEKAARKKPNLRKEEPAPVEEKPTSVPEIKAPVAEETNPVVETSVPVVEEATPVAKETPAAETITPTSRPAPVQPTSQFALPGSKGTCTVYRNGIHYQLKGQDFFAPYEEIDNLYVTLGVYYMMYKGKDYHIDVYQRNGQEKELVKAAFQYATEKWNAAKAAAPVVSKGDSEPTFTVENTGSILKVYDTYCMLTAKKNAMTLLVTNKFYAGEKKFYYADLTSVQFREPGAITDGYLEFEFPGSRSSKNADAYTSENAISFAKNHLPLMRQVYAFIDSKIAEAKQKKNQPAATALSPADELKKYKELLDAGAISQAEFDQKKQQLLGL